MRRIVRSAAAHRQLTPVLALVSMLVFASPENGRGQETASSASGVRIAGAAGHTSAYRGGPTYLLSMLFLRSSGLAIEIAAEVTPAPIRGNAETLWLGIRSREGWLGGALQLGGRGGILQGPSETGLLADVHLSLELGWRSVGIILEPAYLVGLAPSPFRSTRLVLGAYMFL